MQLEIIQILEEKVGMKMVDLAPLRFRRWSTKIPGQVCFDFVSANLTSQRVQVRVFSELKKSSYSTKYLRWQFETNHFGLLNVPNATLSYLQGRLCRRI